MAKKADQKATGSIGQLEVLHADGSRSRLLAAPNFMPGDLTPGEFVNLPSGTTLQWYVFADKQRFWDGSAWQVTGTLVPFDPGSMTEADMYALRRKLLSHFGWIN